MKNSEIFLGETSFPLCGEGDTPPPHISLGEFGAFLASACATALDFDPHFNASSCVKFYTEFSTPSMSYCVFLYVQNTDRIEFLILKLQI